MNTSVLAIEQPAPQDKLMLTLFLAAAMHGIVILGVGFSPWLEEMRTPPALEVILVEKRPSDTPEEADYLAQAAQDGGGESDDNARPSSPFVSQQDFDTDGIAPAPMEASAPAPVDTSTDAVLTTVFSEQKINTDEARTEAIPDIKNEALLLIEQNLEIARLSAEINSQVETMAKRPRKKYLNARTHEAASAEYMFHWVEQVERVGNLNYPDSARQQNLTGALVLVVGIFRDGTIESVNIEESSGHRVLDDAARRIVEMAGPFAPLSGKLAEETDILYIVRTWEFESSNSITSY